MIIGGLQKFSLCDFPGRTAAVVFTRGCNFRCRFCHNGHLISPRPDPERDLPQGEVIDFLEKRRHQLDGVVICGGEPTLQVDLLEFIKLVRLLGYQVKLDTNGSRPDLIRQALEQNLVDFVAMDIKAPWGAYNLICDVTASCDSIKESVKIIAASSVQHEFRTTWVKSLLSRQDILQIRRQLPANINFRIQDFQPDNALDATL